MDKNDPKMSVSQKKRRSGWIDLGQPSAVLLVALAAILFGGHFFGGHCCAFAQDVGGVDVEEFSTDDIEIQEIPARPVAARTPSTPPSTPSSKPSSTPREPGSQRRSGPELMGILTHEITVGLGRRQLDSDWTQFENYAGHQLNLSTGNRRVNEITGNCRLSWFDHLLRNPMSAPRESEAFTRELFESMKRPGGEGWDRALEIAREKMDVFEKPPASIDDVTDENDPLSRVAEVLEDVRRHHAESLAPLSRVELQQLEKTIYPLLVSQNDVGFTLANRVAGRRVCDLLEKIDRTAIHDAAAAMVRLADADFLQQLHAIPDESTTQVRGVTGPVVRKLVTPAGCILIGGRGANTYDLDAMMDVHVIIDLGGNDVYREGSVGMQRPVLITLDLAGDDVYTGTKPGIQGSAALGMGMLVDVEGDDRYEARDVAQGSCIGGVGLLIDQAGNDRYSGFRRVQGHAFAGIGWLLDREGDDQYHGAMWTQGMGGPLGFAVLADLDGQDRYYTGGHFICSYADDEDNPTPGYEGWGQGVGAGLRSIASGGIGVILDGGGDDVYEFDYLSHGGGYWLGLGFARDFGGNDQRLGATVKEFDGSTRTQPRFQRFGIGFGCHYAAGFCIDDQGDDTYHGTIMGLGHAWDCAIAMLADFDGNDRYRSSGKTTQGNGSQAGVGILFDVAGDDRYEGSSQGYASSSISYHETPHCGGNFSFLIDHAGDDRYGSRARNGRDHQQGSRNGFLVDRGESKPTSTPRASPRASQQQTRQQTRQPRQATQSQRRSSPPVR